jgi:Txe/YoeB family toxin of Txe-Axe toxin-antitoxin module
MNQDAKKEIRELQNEVNEISEKWMSQIYGICEKLDYKNSSNFSYNIDRLKRFVQELNDFKPIK